MTKFTAVKTIPGTLDAGIIMLCDHASNALPPEYGTLGLAPEQLERHIAYDIGARDTALTMAQVLGCTLIMSCYSRLLIDPNRGADDPTLIMRLSDGAIVPGNADVDAVERQERIVRFHAPYHPPIRPAIDASLAHGIAPRLISLHSFTPRWKNFSRPWPNHKTKQRLPDARDR